MLSRILVLCICLAVSGCQLPLVKDADMLNVRAVWVASEANGDKPGFGFKLIEETGQISATFFLLDPNKPHDFEAGRPFPTEIIRSRKSELHFVVRLEDNRKEEFVIQLQRPLRGDLVNATLRDFERGTKPTALLFVRQNQRVPPGRTREVRRP